MFEDTENQPLTTPYWPSVSDLFMTLFIIALALVGTIYYLLTPKQKPGEAQSIVEAVGVDMRNIREPVNTMRRALEPPVHELLRGSQPPREIVQGLSATADEVAERLRINWKELYEKEKARNAKAQDEIARLEKALNDKPPIIDLVDVKTLSFVKGSGEISEAFREQLDGKQFGKLIRIVNAYKNVDTIEIIGHTDASRVGSSSNLDTGLAEVLSGSGKASALKAGSNADLGLMRAFAVKEEWLRWLKEEHIQLPRPVGVRCYSAAQGVPPDNMTTVTPQEQEAKARRIEIRFTQLTVPKQM